MSSFDCHNNRGQGDRDGAGILPTLPMKPQDLLAKVMWLGSEGGFSPDYCDCFLNTKSSLRKWKESGIHYKIHPCNRIKGNRNTELIPNAFVKGPNETGCKNLVLEHWRPSTLYARGNIWLIQMTNLIEAREKDLQLTADDSSHIQPYFVYTSLCIFKNLFLF